MREPLENNLHNATARRNDMAKFVDDRQEEIELSEEEQLDSLEETPIEEEEQTQEEEEVVETEESEELPDKYHGKSVADIIAMHQNAEQLLGKQGQEVGELRKIVDDFIKSQTIQKEEQAHTELEEIDDTAFFENPKEAIKKILDNHPSIKQSQQMAVQIRQQEALSRLKAEHPDFMDIIKDASFAEWVGKSKIRTKLLQEADSKYDFDSADELLTLWKERQQAVNETVQTEKEQRKQNVKTASTGTSKGSGERPSRKIYRRSDIIELMRTDPARYEQLMPEIRQAYSEGRVK
jgi:hypothetical protein